MGAERSRSRSWGAARVRREDSTAGGPQIQSYSRPGGMTSDLAFTNPISASQIQSYSPADLYDCICIFTSSRRGGVVAVAGGIR